MSYTIRERSLDLEFGFAIVVPLIENEGVSGPDIMAFVSRGTASSAIGFNQTCPAGADQVRRSRASPKMDTKMDDFAAVNLS